MKTWKWILLAAAMGSDAMARTWLEVQMPLDLNLTFSGEDIPFAQYRIEPSLGV